ncbi:hypothetical protein ACQKKL_28335, partial [Escherichia coli]|uniref:hypothetical protein n=6 Tax=Gammaproteobacteria TaxID=1236 RepID=UPI003CFFC8C2
AYRKEASRLVSLANKRVQRLELNGLTDSPAYKAYIASGGKFGVRGKSHNELQQEVARLNRFINSTTSTIKGVNKTLKEMADNTGITYRDLKELRAKSSKFFELANKVEQYLRTVDDMASAIGYQKIWETINTYVKRGDIDLGDADNDVDNMVDVVTKAIKEYERPDVNQFSNWYKIRED